MQPPKKRRRGFRQISSIETRDTHFERLGIQIRYERGRFLNFVRFTIHFLYVTTAKFSIKYIHSRIANK